jgi:hypothetical protein
MYKFAAVLLALICIYLYIGLVGMRANQQEWIDAGAIQRDPTTKELHFVPCEVGI